METFLIAATLLALVVAFIYPEALFLTVPEGPERTKHVRSTRILIVFAFVITAIYLCFRVAG